jgi:hypothetical protein
VLFRSNLDLVPKVNDVYETMMGQDEKNRDHIAIAHRNFLRNAIYFLYQDNQVAEAAKWFRYLGEKYPDKPILDNDPNSFPRNLTLDDYAVACVQEEIGNTSQERTTAAVQGLLRRAYYELAIGQDDRHVGFKLLAGKVYEHYQAKISGMKGNLQRIGLPPFADLDRAVLNQLLDPQEGVPYAMRAVIRTQLGMPGETNVPPTTVLTNTTAAATVSSNAPAAGSSGSTK